MGIRITDDGRVFVWTPREILREMQHIALGQDNQTLAEYIDWLARQIEQLDDKSPRMRSHKTDERALALLGAMLSSRLTEKN